MSGMDYNYACDKKSHNVMLTKLEATMKQLEKDAEQEKKFIEARAKVFEDKCDMMWKEIFAELVKEGKIPSNMAYDDVSLSYREETGQLFWKKNDKNSHQEALKRLLMHLIKP